MKNLIISVIALTSLSTFAGESDSLNLVGAVEQILNISVAPAATASNLDLHTNASDLTVAQVTETSNSKSGYKVAISSSNGQLQHGDGASVGALAYTLKYGGQTVDLTNGSTVSYAAPAKGTSAKTVSISYTGIAQEDMAAGNYSDNVSFTISAN